MTTVTANHIANLVIQSYISVMGRENWDSKTTEQQHDIIMILIRDALKALEKAEKEGNLIHAE